MAKEKVSDVISRQAAIATVISGRIRTLPTTEDGENWIRVEDVRESLLNLPLAQPEIVYCGECKYQNKGENEVDEWNQCGFRPWLYIPVHDEHYCSWGERREE